MKRKIVILSLTLGYGGIEKYISSLCKMLGDKYEIKIICNYKQSNKPAFDYHNASIEYVYEREFRNASLKELLKRFKILEMLKELTGRFILKFKEKKLIVKKIKEANCDIIITTRLAHNRIINKYFKKTSILKIATEHNSYDIYKNYDKKICSSVKNFDYLVLVSKQLKNHYDKMVDNCVYIPNIIDEKSKDMSLLNMPYLISVGRFSHEKGFLDLISVMSEVVKLNNNIKLYLVGDGYQRDEIKNLILKLGLNNNIILTGFISQGELKKYYLKSSLYIMTSYSEAFGIVLLEAMNYGIPCIAFDSASGASEVISKEVGILIKNRDKKKMANTIVKLLNDTKKMNEYQKNIKKYITSFTVKEVIKEYEKILNIN